jgi:tetratricopeptide (TPR) repeat protein
MTLPKTVAVWVLLAAALFVGRARAEENDNVREAGKHFQRGVSLYNEADYRSALVEFKRAGTLSPNPAVLYNIGETQFQLQDYAGALTSFERYLSEASASDSHHNEVENNVQALRSRVGFVSIATVPAGAEVTIDDQPAGRTPLDKPVRVTIGQRKIVATLAGRSAVVRYIDVAAEDNVSVSLQLGSAGPDALLPPPPQPTPPVSDVSRAPRGGSGATTARVLGWVATGALAAGGVTFGIMAIGKSGDLKTQRETYPTTADALDHTANLATTYSILADALGAGALIVGGITLYSTLSSAGSAGPSGKTTRVTIGVKSVRFETVF